MIGNACQAWKNRVGTRHFLHGAEAPAPPLPGLCPRSAIFVLDEVSQHRHQNRDPDPASHRGDLPDRTTIITAHRLVHHPQRRSHPGPGRWPDHRAGQPRRTHGPAQYLPHHGGKGQSVGVLILRAREVRPNSTISERIGSKDKLSLRRLQREKIITNAKKKQGKNQGKNQKNSKKRNHQRKQT